MAFAKFRSKTQMFCRQWGSCRAPTKPRNENTTFMSIARSGAQMSKPKMELLSGFKRSSPDPWPSNAHYVEDSALAATVTTKIVPNAIISNVCSITKTPTPHRLSKSILRPRRSIARSILHYKSIPKASAAASAEPTKMSTNS